ncbi:hypothetical protein IE53DRAFT_369407, partial [Violaceomyces palustris]
HVYPTSGGQYHWAFALSPPRYRNVVAFFTGWIATSGWVALTATASSLAGQLIVGLIAIMHDNYESKPWHIFLVYIAFAIGAWFINAFGARILDGLNKVAMTWSLVGALVITITCLSRASPNYQSGTYVFGTLVNYTGWPDGIAFILGLLQSTFALIGVDGATHLIDEIERPSMTAPRAMILSVVIGASSTFVVLVVFLFVLTDLETVVSGSNGALLEIIYQATRNRVAAVCLLVFPVVSMAFTATALLTTSSRMTEAFARDRGLPFSRILSKISREVPIAALTLTTFWVIVFGCIYLGSSAALNAILGSSIVLLQASYFVPIFLVLLGGRSKLLDLDGLPPRTFSLGRILGPLINAFSLVFIIFTNIFFLFPPALPVSGSSMNYTVVVCAVVAILSTIAWFTQGRKHFKGPLDMDEVLLRTRGLAVLGGREESLPDHGQGATTALETEKVEVTQ